jgi:hypothetical protein
MSNKSLDEQLADALKLSPERRRVARSQNSRQNDRGVARQSGLFSYFYSRPQNPPRRGDGQDHINIYSRCETDLGAALYSDTALEFVHNMLGRCASVMAAWDFLATGAGNTRLLTTPAPLRRKMLKDVPMQKFEHEDYVFMDLTWSQVNSYPMLKEAIIESTLPFDSYRVGGAMALSSRHPFSRRVIEAHEIIRAALKNNQEPDFSAYAGDKTREQIFDQFRSQIPESRSSRKNNSLLRALTRMPVHTAPKKPVNNKRPLPPVSNAPETAVGTHRLNYILQDLSGSPVTITPGDEKFTALASDINRYLDRIVTNGQIPKNKLLKEVEAAVGVYFDLHQELGQPAVIEDESVKPDLTVEVSFVENLAVVTAFLYNSDVATSDVTTEVDIPLDDPVVTSDEEQGSGVEVIEQENTQSEQQAVPEDEGVSDIQGNYFYLHAENGDPLNLDTLALKKYLVDNNFTWSSFSNWLIDGFAAAGSAVQLNVLVDDQVTSQDEVDKAQVILMIGAETIDSTTVFHVRVINTDEEKTKLAEKTFSVAAEDVDALNFRVSTSRYDSLDNSGPIFLVLTHEETQI